MRGPRGGPIRGIQNDKIWFKGFTTRRRKTMHMFKGFATRRFRWRLPRGPPGPLRKHGEGSKRARKGP
eukprot:2082302-Pyramimonas_sp.AAC.3